MAGTFKMSDGRKIKIKLFKFNHVTHIVFDYHINYKKSNYDVIFGTRDILRNLGIYLDFQNTFIGWQNTRGLTKLISCKIKSHFAIQESKNVVNITNRIKIILDTNYEKANLTKIVCSFVYLGSDE